MNRYFIALLAVIALVGCNVDDDPELGNNRSNNENNINNSNNVNNSNNGQADCAGVIGGDAVEDMCGTCDADPTNDCVEDCAGVFGGDAVEDMCGVCDNDATNDCVADCAGEFGGDAVEDMCGVCDDDATNDCVEDCNGEFGGTAVTDTCGRCVEGTTGLVACPTATITAVADAHVDSRNPDTNYGNEAEVLVDRTTTETYVKFDLSSLPNDIVIRALTLRLTATDSQDFGGNGDVNVYFASTDDWQEDTITYATKPNFSDFIQATYNVAGATAGSDTVLEVIDDPELLEIFQGQVFGDKLVTLMMASAGYQSKYHSLQGADPNLAISIDVSYQVLSKVDVVAVADTYVDNSSPDTNYGTSESLEVNPFSRASADPRHTTYVKFDLSTVPSNVNIERVVFNMLAYNGFAYGGNGTCYTYLLDDDTWDESTLTFNTIPTFQPEPIGSWWLWYDRTPVDRVGATATDELLTATSAAYTDDKLISFRLASSGYHTQYRSREYADSTQHPKLTLYFTAN